MLLAQCMLDLWPGAGLFAEPDAANRLETREAGKPAHHLAYHPVCPAHCDDHWHPEWWDVGLIACLFASLSARLSVLLPNCLPTCTCRCLSAWLTVFVSSLSCIFSLFKEKFVLISSSLPASSDFKGVFDMFPPTFLESEPPEFSRIAAEWLIKTRCLLTIAFGGYGRGVAIPFFSDPG